MKALLVITCEDAASYSVAAKAIDSLSLSDRRVDDLEALSAHDGASIYLMMLPHARAENHAALIDVLEELGRNWMLLALSPLSQLERAGERLLNHPRVDWLSVPCSEQEIAWRMARLEETRRQAVEERLALEARLAKAQDQLTPTERQTIVAELAGTAAHELNQPLTSILGYAELIRRRLTQAQDIRALDIIIREAERMADVVRKLAHINEYKTKDYVGDQRILDLDSASSIGSEASRFQTPSEPVRVAPSSQPGKRTK